MRLSIKNITKRYGDNLALDNFTAEFEPGIYALLGPNGSGKSTLMNIITDNLKADSGQITCDGEDTLAMGERFREKIGFMPQYPGLYPNFTVERFMWYMAALKGLPKGKAKKDIPEILAAVELDDIPGRRIGALSGGMKQRLTLAQAVLGDSVRGLPELLILDEPTAGLDPAGRDEIFELVRSYHKQSGATILIVSHSMEDIAQVADRLLVMNHAKVLFCDTPREVFSHADEIIAAGLDIPMITKVMLELKKRGHDVDTSVYTVAQAMDALRACKRKEAAHEC